MKIIRKLSIRLILFQILFLYFLSQTTDRFYYTLNYEFYECLYNHGSELGGQCFEKYPGYTLSDLWTYPIYFMLGGLLLAMIITGFVNWKKKKYFLNTLLVCVLYITLHFAGFFKFTRDLDLLLMSFGNIFSDKFWVMNLITVQIHLFSSILMIWLSVKGKTKVE
jgi:hypothetical protein